MNAASRRGAAHPPEDPERVTVHDLGRIGALQSLLATLNDPRAGADVLARQVAAIPVLRARIERRFAMRNPNAKRCELSQQIALLGNRALEGILGELLEDIIALHSEIEPAKRYSF